MNVSVTHTVEEESESRELEEPGSLSQDRKSSSVNQNPESQVPGTGMDLLQAALIQMKNGIRGILSLKYSQC